MKTLHIAIVLMLFCFSARADPAPSCKKAQELARQAANESDAAKATAASRKALDAAGALPMPGRRACLRELVEDHDFGGLVLDTKELAEAFDAVAQRDSPLHAAGKGVAAGLREQDIKKLLPWLDENVTIGNNNRGPRSIRGEKGVKGWLKHKDWENGLNAVAPVLLCDEKCCDFFPGSQRVDRTYYLQKLCFTEATKLAKVVWEKPE